MVEPLGARLVRAGLVTRELLAEATEQSSHRGIALAEALVACGLDEDSLAGYMLAGGHGPLLESRVLRNADRSYAERVGRSMAEAYLALPLRGSPEGIVVAMVDPSDEDAIQALRALLDEPVVPKVARVGELRAAIVTALPHEGPPSDERGARAKGARSEDVTAEIPLVRQKSPRGTSFAAPAPFSLPESRPADEPTWGDLAAAPPPPREPTPRARSKEPEGPRVRFGPRIPAPGATTPPGDVGTFLAALRAAESRDEALRIACEAGITVGAQAVFLGLRKGLLVGWEGLGPGLSHDALRSLWVPITAPSVLTRALESGKAHYGPHGVAPADQLFRAATGCRGARLAVHPVFVTGRPMGVLCVDDPRYADKGQERLAVLAHALGEAMKRLILHRKI